MDISSVDNETDIDLSEGAKSVEWVVHFPPSGMTSLFVYFPRARTPNDVIIDSHGEKLGYQVQNLEIKGHTRYVGNVRYYKEYIRVYFIYDLLLFFFAFVSGIGALFEVLNFFFK